MGNPGFRLLGKIRNVVCFITVALNLAKIVQRKRHDSAQNEFLNLTPGSLRAVGIFY